MSKLSDLDINQIFRQMINPDTMALKTEAELSGEFSMELNADDGDSVQVRPMCSEVLNIQAGQVLEVSNARSMFISTNGSMNKILASLDAEIWHEIASDRAFMNLENIAFKFIKIEAESNVTIKAMIKG